jgi:hypothetical protein
LAMLAMIIPTVSGGGVRSGLAVLRKCVPDTLGSDAFRKHQVYTFASGHITQPNNDGVCLTATDAVEVQPAAGPRGMAWGIWMQPCTAAAAANQTWELTAHGNIVLAALGMCIDIAGYGTESGSVAHLWPCTNPGTNPCPPTTHCPSTSCTCVANQQWTWEPDGNVVGVMSSLCLDTGSTGWWILFG